MSADLIMTTPWWNSRSSVLSLLLLVAAASSYTASASTECYLKVEECPNTLKELHIESVMIPGCCEWPCELHRNTNVSIIVGFHTDVSYSMIEQQMCMAVGGLCLPTYKGLPTNICNLISCPIKVGNHYQLTEKLAIAEAFPNIVAVTRLMFYMNDHGVKKSIGCLAMDIRTVP